MARKKKEETPEERPEIKSEKVNPYGWRNVVNKAKFTKPK